MENINKNFQQEMLTS